MPDNAQISLLEALAFGDSVMWGQGILHENKFCTRIAKDIFKIDFPPSAILAHSGAKLGSRNDSDDSANDNVNGEIPRPEPSVLRQILTYGLNTPNGKKTKDLLPDLQSDLQSVTFPDVKVVFINGGINEIGGSNLIKKDLYIDHLNRDISKIDRFKKMSENRRCYYRLKLLENRISTIAYTNFLEVLKIARKKFPNALICTFNYHFVFSQRSATELIDAADKHIDEGDDKADQIRLAIRQCSWFMGLSSAEYQRAVWDFNSQDLGSNSKGAIFIPSLHGPQHATFADETLSWTSERVNVKDVAWDILTTIFTHDLPLSKYTPNDEVVESRKYYCRVYYNPDNRGVLEKDKEDYEMCQVAGLFHPNKSSATEVTKIARRVNHDFSNPPSLRDLLDRKTSLRHRLNSLGIDSPVTYRQLFANHIVGSISLKATVQSGSSSEFPYNQFYIEFETSKNRTFTYALNGSLGFVKGVADGNDDIFPTPSGRLVKSGDIVGFKPVERDTEINFFAYPYHLFSLFEIRVLRIRVKQRSFEVYITLKDIEININGFNIIKSNNSIVLNAKTQHSYKAEIGGRYGFPSFISE